MKRYIPLLLVLCCIGVSGSCNFGELENKADIDIIDVHFIRKNAAVMNQLLAELEEVEVEVEARVALEVAIIMAENAALIATVQSRPRTFVSPFSGDATAARPGDWPQACCWSTTTTGNRAPNDNGNVNTYGDNCFPISASNINTTTGNTNRWSSNYMRTGRGAHTNAIDEGHWITFDLGANYMITGFRYQGRDNGSGRAAGMDIYVSTENDIARNVANPSNSNDGTHPGHYPPESKKVPHTQTFADTNAWQPNNTTTNNIITPAYGRYIQFRMNVGRTPGVLDSEVGARNIEIRRDNVAGVDLLAEMRATMLTIVEDIRAEVREEYVDRLKSTILENEVEVTYSYL